MSISSAYAKDRTFSGEDVGCHLKTHIKKTKPKYVNV